MGGEVHDRPLSGHIEVDGAYFGGYVKPENVKAERKDWRLAANRSCKRRVVVIMRERHGKALPFVFDNEADSLPTIARPVELGSTIYADEAPSWDALHARYAAKRVNHSVNFGTLAPIRRKAISRTRSLEHGSGRPQWQSCRT